MQSQQASESLAAALAYAKRGWMVFPLKPGEKTPLTPNGFKDATTNENIIVRWWDRWPDANIGIATGPESGIWVLDIDAPDGDKSLGALESELATLPRTLEQVTGGGGKQLFFRWPAREIRNRQGLRPGIDVRGNGGYVVVPPSLHPCGKRYEWDGGKGDIEPAEAPPEWLEFIAPAKRNIAPWGRIAPAPAAPPPMIDVTRTPIIDRARKYLAECAPAVQGQAGHDALLWAARALVVGFELDDSTALNLLWSEFNPRCKPQWNRSRNADIRDFERKVGEARRTPGEKPRGWLLDECGLRPSIERLAQIGRESAANLLAGARIAADPTLKENDGQRIPFPLGHLPSRIADYCRKVAQAHVVDESFAGLPALVVAGAAMGNAWRLELKRGFVVPPTLWAGVIAPSGTNKSGPLKEIMEPLSVVIPVADDDDALLTPQGRTVVSDATLEAVIARLNENPRGLLVFRDELAGWAKGFNAYRKGGGGDEQAWLEFWGAGSYVLDRKTNNEQTRIPAASCCVLGGIQPSVFAECMDPGKFASGLVPRILIACPPETDMWWSEAVVDEHAEAEWHDAIIWLRRRPFAAFNMQAGRHEPHVLALSNDAKAAYVGFFNSITHQMAGRQDEHFRSIASKARIMAGRLALIHRGLYLATEARGDAMAAQLPLASMEAGIAWAQWCLAEQLRVYGFAGAEHAKQQAERLAEAIAKKYPSTKRASIRQICRMDSRRYPNAEAAVQAAECMVQQGVARWEPADRKVGVVLS